MEDYATYKRDLGYNDPLDESPVEVPEGWNGGLAENTGGNIICRIWRTFTPGEKGDEVEYEVIYDVSENKGIGLDALQWDEELEGYITKHLVTVESVDVLDDELMAETAQEMMEKFNEGEYDLETSYSEKMDED